MNASELNDSSPVQMSCQSIYRHTLSLGPVELVPSIAVGKISDFDKHVVAIKRLVIFERRSQTIEYSNRANKFVEIVQRTRVLRRRKRLRPVTSYETPA